MKVAEVMDLTALKGLDEAELKTVVRSYERFEDHLLSYEGDNQKQAFELLRVVLDDEEKHALLECLLGDNGWYCSNNGRHANMLKVISYALGQTSNRFSFRKYNQDAIEVLLRTIPKDEQLLLMSSYIKQKLVTYYTLVNNSITELELFRGLDEYPFNEYYSSCNLESWSLKFNKARHFAYPEGVVIRKTIPIIDVFVYRDSIFQPENALNLDSFGYISTEEEYIIENQGSLLELREGITFVKYQDHF
ncbi:MAG: hypothetical protein P4L49_07055 [Desulfosporosinus sp.]|nr:hypothetical protein [Desulfosporosinus sp.]